MCSIVKKPDYEREYVGQYGELDEDDEPTNIIDFRSSLQLTIAYRLQWSDISLSVLPPLFLSHDIIQTEQITHVDLSHNQLLTVPLELFQLPTLTSLNLSHNHISSIPSTSLWGKTTLEMLNLSYNNLASDPTPPAAVKRPGDMIMFRFLWYVDISYCSLTHCPPWIITFYNLKHLDLSGNKVSRAAC